MQRLGSPYHTPPKAPQRESELPSQVIYLQEALACTPGKSSLPSMSVVYILAASTPPPNTPPSVLTILLQPNYLWKLVSRNNFLLGTTPRLCSHLSQCASVCSTPVLTHSYLQTLPTFQLREYPLSWPTFLVFVPPPPFLLFFVSTNCGYSSEGPYKKHKASTLYFIKWGEGSQAIVKLSKHTCDKGLNSCREFYQLNETQCLLLNKYIIYSDSFLSPICYQFNY